MKVGTTGWMSGPSAGLTCAWRWCCHHRDVEVAEDVVLGVGANVVGVVVLALDVHGVVVVFLAEDVLVADPEDVHRDLAL